MYQKVCLIITFLILSFVPVSSQNTHKGLANLPVKTRYTFTKQYKECSEVIWTLLDKQIAISFKTGEIYKEAFYTSEGKWIRTETQLELDSLPIEVKKSVNSREFVSWHKGSAYLMELPGNKKKYKVYVYSADWNELELTFNEKGIRLINNL